MAYPIELQNYNAWVNWRYEDKDSNGKVTKVPYNPATALGASSTDPATWASHSAALAAVTHYSGIGFSLSDADPYTMIDLDDPWKRKDHTYIQDPASTEYQDAAAVWESHWQIVKTFDSYTEWSPSGRGLRIIVKGKLPPGFGNRVGKIEVYSRLRYMTITGNHIEGTPHTIEDRQGTLEIFAAKLGLDNRAAQGPVHDQEETRNDPACVSAAWQGATGEAFQRLWNGDTTSYPSGSEADLAFANFICFQTNNFAQAERIFRASPYFAAREKLHRRDDLVTKAIRKGFDRKAPPIDTSLLLSNMKVVANTNAPQIAPTVDPILQSRPEGIVGDLAEFIYQAAPRPVREIALAGSIGFLAGVCGRAWNVNGTGLNQYVVLLSNSGAGKEAISSGISKIMPYLAENNEAAELFLGPSMIASQPALHKIFATRSRSIVSILGEFGRWLRIHLDERANTTQQGLVLAFLDLWGKSGKGQMVRESVYSDKAKNVEALNAPAFSFIGESVPETFYAMCTEGAITSGLIPRMLIIEYLGDRMPLNPASLTAKPTQIVVSSLRSIIQNALIRNNKHDPLDVPFAPDAAELIHNFDVWCDAQMNGSKSNIVKSIWNRSHLKACKVAALIAVGRNWVEPEISLRDATWAIAHVKEDAHKILSRFDSGDVSSGHIDDDKERAVIKVIRKYFAPEFKADSYPIPAHYRENGLVPVSHIRTQAGKAGCFRKAASGPKSIHELVNRTVKELCDNNVLALLKAPAGIPGTLITITAEAVMVLDAKRFQKGD